VDGGLDRNTFVKYSTVKQFRDFSAVLILREAPAMKGGRFRGMQYKRRLYSDRYDYWLSICDAVYSDR
jgi:hypothetical protein